MCLLCDVTRMPTRSSELESSPMAVLQKFRVIYGSMRRHFRDIEDRCGLPASQVWVLQEVQNSPGIGITELSQCIGVHQSTCSQLVEKLVARGCLVKIRHDRDHRRVGLRLCPEGERVVSLLTGPAEGLLPAALNALPEVVLKTLDINLTELIRYLPRRSDAFAHVPLAEMVGANEALGGYARKESAALDLECEGT